MLRFIDLARLQHRIDRDASLPLPQLRARDSEIGKNRLALSPAQQILHWLDACEDQEQASSYQPSHPEGFITFILGIVAFLLGVSAMAAVLLVKGGQTVNVLVFLGLFIFLQWLFLLATLISAFLPLNKQALQGPLSFINPAFIGFKRLLKSFSYSMPWEKLPKLSRLLVLCWSQYFGLIFNIGLLICFWTVLLFTDKNFVWASTFNINANTFHQVLNIISIPWASVVETAVLDINTINLSRSNALQTQHSSEQIEAMRLWWPFLLCALVTYGLLPRAVLYVVFKTMFQRQLHTAILNFPGVNLVLNRLQAPVVSTKGLNNQNKENNHAIDKVETKTNFGNTSTIVNWVNALQTNKQYSAQHFDLASTHSAGLDLEEDQQLIQTLNNSQELSIIIVVKSWEPPLAELKDFIDSIDANKQCSLLLLPLNNSGVDSDELKDWQQFTAHTIQRPINLLQAETV